jgi:hypothetical protein
MLNLSFNTYRSFLLTVPGGTRSMSTALLSQIQLVALYQSALGAAELQTHFTDGATTSWFS